MPITVACPECDSRLKLKADSAGKKVRCPRCKIVFPVPAEDEEEDERPAKRRRPASRDEEDEGGRRRRSASTRSREDEEEEERPSSRKKLWLIGGGIGAGVLAVGIIVLLVAGKGGGGKEEDKTDPDNNPRVTDGVLQEIKVGLSRLQVEEILGKGRPTSLGEAQQFVEKSYPERDPDKPGRNQGGPPNISFTAGGTGARNWYYWQNGQMRIYVGFGDRAVGEPVASSFYVGRVGGKGYKFITVAHAREDVNQA